MNGMAIHYQKLIDVISQYLQLITVLSIPLFAGIGSLFHFYLTERKARLKHLLWCLFFPAVLTVIPLLLVIFAYGKMIFSLAGGSVVPFFKSWAGYFALVPLPCFLISIVWTIIGLLFLRRKYPANSHKS